MDVIRRELLAWALCAGALRLSDIEAGEREMSRKTLESEVLRTVEALNRAWTVDRSPGRLTEFFHPRMVAITPGDRERREGAESCVAGWSGFADANRVTAWRTRGEKVQLWAEGRVAVVTYYYEMSWVSAEGGKVDSAGRDMMVLARDNGRWWLVADQFSPYPAAE